MTNNNFSSNITNDLAELSYESFKNEVINDYKTACISREASLMGRREVLTGKAKFGIFGDGKEVPQIALSKFFKAGDWRSGYYRDQSWMMASGITTPDQFFSQLYGDPDPTHDFHSAGRNMNSHYATKNRDINGNWANLTAQLNTAADMAPTAGQMPRALGLAAASKTFRNVEELKAFTNLSNNGNEVCFCTIGDASTSEGHFWEVVNAASVMQVPLAIFIWDDGYGISVPKAMQTTKASISEALKGFQIEPGTNGLNIYNVKAWDYAGMCEVFETGIAKIRETHTPAIFHVEEVTQPQGHSTSGSHERYKTQERLEWEREWDCIRKMKEWIVENDLATLEQVEELEIEAKTIIKNARQKAWSDYIEPIKEQKQYAVNLIKKQLDNGADYTGEIQKAYNQLEKTKEPLRRDIMHALGIAVEMSKTREQAVFVNNYYNKLKEDNKGLYNSYLYDNGPKSALKVAEVKAEFDAEPVIKNGFEILNTYFDQLFKNNPLVVAFGEDLGYIGDVNQGFAGLQAKYGAYRIADSGIRELSIMGQGIGMALRGLRPIAEIQYLDYLLYGLQPLSDDVASLHYRTVGQQSCPIIVRTRGHRLEGIWHSGSPMGMIVNSLRGMYVCVPRNMVQAAGMYNTLLQSNDPAIVIECLNGYRLKEKQPANLSDFTVPLGIPETLKEGSDLTIVSYGSTLRIVMDAAEKLEQLDISVEVIDVQTLLPFDINHKILESLKKTSRILFVDEDVPGGAVSYMYNQVMEVQRGYRYLDATPRTLAAQAHRPAYGSDGDYFSKPNVEDIITMVKDMMAE